MNQTLEPVLKVVNIRKSFKIKGVNKGEDKHIQVLNDVNFTLYKGECLGITGPNGSGKSTLLRIIAEIIKPDSGEIFVKGKIASILDIGAGFHPELNAIENIYLIGQIHGFTKRYLKNKIEEIFEFSEVGDFRNEPIKNFSNGMFLRLAFSTVTCLDFDIFLFDEVLSVGDIYFQIKCRKRFKDLIRKGKTILLVSHQNQELSICSRLVNMDELNGKHIANDFGSSNKVVAQSGWVNIVDFEEDINSPICLKDFNFYQKDNNTDYVANKDFTIKFKYEKHCDTIVYPAIIVSNQNGQNIIISSPFQNIDLEPSDFIKQQEFDCTCILPKDFFSSEVYGIGLIFMEQKIQKNSFGDILNEEKSTKIIKSYNPIHYFRVKLQGFNPFDELTDNVSMGGALVKMKWELL